MAKTENTLPKVTKNEKPWDALYNASTSLKEHLNDFASISDLWKVCARAGGALAHCQREVGDGELDDAVDMLNHFVCILELLEKFDNASK